MMPAKPLSDDERRVFGADAQRCEKTGRIFETGIGALPREQQSKNFIREAKELGNG